MSKRISYSELGNLSQDDFFQTCLSEINRGIFPKKAKIKQLDALGIHMYPLLKKVSIHKQDLLDTIFQKQREIVTYGNRLFSTQLNIVYQEWFTPEIDVFRANRDAEALQAKIIKDDQNASKAILEIKENNFFGRVNAIKKIIQNFPDAFFDPGSQSLINIRPQTFEAISCLLGTKVGYKDWIGVLGNAFEANNDAFIVDLYKKGSLLKSKYAERYLINDFRFLLAS